MRFLFIVQGEGRGHLTQALALRDILTENGHEVVAVLVGESNRRELPDFFLKKIQSEVLRFESPNFLPVSKCKHVIIWTSIFYNLLKTGSYLKSIRFIRGQIKNKNVDVVVNFYEMLTGLTYAFFPPKVPYICIAHQYLFLHPDYKFPRANKLELYLLRTFTRITCFKSSKLFALSTQKMEDFTKRKIVVSPPLLRKEVIEAEVSDGNYLHGYMLNDNYADEIIRFNEKRPDVEINFFWDRKGVEERVVINDNLSFYRLNDQLFIKFMAGCKGYATTAGFESVCEAMFMGKPVLMAPTHIEQACNAFEAAKIGAGIITSNFELDKLLDYIHDYRKKTDFRVWVLQAPELILKELEKINLSNPQ